MDTEVVQSTKQFTIVGFPVTSAMTDGGIVKSSRWNVGGCDWEVHVLPKESFCGIPYITLDLYLCSEVSTDCIRSVKAKFSCWLIDPSGKLRPSQEKTESRDKIMRSGDGIYCVFLISIGDLQASGYLKDDSFTIKCTLTVLKELAEKHRPAHDLVPSSSLHHRLGELLQNATGADVTFIVSGVSFPAHKAILASASPVFMAEFFGDMKERRSQRVEIKDMEAAVFGAMLRFIYTDTAPALDRPEDGIAIAQHLLVAADRYGIDSLKLICEDKLYDSISVDTAAATLALAHQHGCSLLKAKCVGLIAGNLEVVMATEGYQHLMESCPMVLNVILKAVCAKKN